MAPSTGQWGEDIFTTKFTKEGKEKGKSEFCASREAQSNFLPVLLIFLCELRG
jgi:hypothetical protein